MPGPYTILMVVACITVVSGIYFTATRQGHSRRTLAVLVGLLTMSAILGGRILYRISNGDTNTVSLWDVSAQGFSLYGGIILPAITGYIFCRWIRIHPWRIADISTPFVGLGITIARIGCFLHGCCFGTETRLPWGVRFPLMSLSHQYQLLHPEGELFFVHPVHPTQLYEAVASLLCVAVALYIAKRHRQAGTQFLTFGICFTLYRIVASGVRVSFQTPPLPWLQPVLYFSILIVSITILLKRYTIHNHSAQHSNY